MIADGRAADGQTKFVMGLGSPPLQDALNPPSTMSELRLLQRRPDRPRRRHPAEHHRQLLTLLSLLEGVGLGEDPTVSKFAPYLRSSTTLTGGGKSLGGGIERLRLVLGLQHAAG